MEKDLSTQTQNIVELRIIEPEYGEFKTSKKTIYSIGKILALELDHDHEEVTTRNQLFVLDL